MSGPVTCGVCSEPLTWVSGEIDETSPSFPLYQVTMRCERCNTDRHRTYEASPGRPPSAGAYIYEHDEGGYRVPTSEETETDG